MSSTFAVIDAGSNALRLQIAGVEQPGTYRIIEQDRRPARLGHKVFQTGALDPESRDQALEALKRFKGLCEKHGTSAIRAVGTSAMREARDSADFIKEAKALGIPLEILSEEEEARLIGVGILSGLSFDPALGLFVDIGGGSAELAVANRRTNSALVSLPIGAVRFSERYLKHDPPSDRDLSAMNRALEQKLEPAVRRLKRERFTMAFGSGGTLTALGGLDARLTGEPRQESLYVLRRARLRSLYDILRSQSAKKREALLADDAKRGDILVAGSAALLAIMTALELDYIFVSTRGLRDGLMVDLLRRQFKDFFGAWTEAVARVESIEEFGEKFNYDKAHSQQVSKLALSLFKQLKDLHGLPDRYSILLHAAAMLHDIGLFIGYKKHHKHSYYLIKTSGPSSFDAGELDIIANVARYHRRSHPSPKDLPFGQLSSLQQDVVRKLAAILRVADGLDYGRQSKIQNVEVRKARSKNLSIKLKGKGDLTDERRAASDKMDLFNEVYGVEAVLV